MSSLTKRSCAAIALLSMTVLAQAQLFKRATPPPMRAVAVPLQPQRKASDLIHRQEPLKLNQSVLKEATPDSVRVVVSIPKQRALLMVGDQIAADSPISSGKRGHSMPTGNFTVLEKDPNHHSSLYGNFV